MMMTEEKLKMLLNFYLLDKGVL